MGRDTLLTVERHLLRDAGVTVDESVPFDLYRTMYPDILAIREEAVDTLRWGMFEEEYEAIYLFAAMAQRANVSNPNKFRELPTEIVAPLLAFQESLRLILSYDDSFTNPAVIKAVSSDISFVLSPIYRENDPDAQVFISAITVYLYRGFLKPETEAAKAFPAALSAAARLVDELRQNPTQRA